MSRESNSNDRLARLEQLVALLRGPDGCPWDREQQLPDLRAYLLEEAHEVAAAIDAGDSQALEDELGDLLFQVVFVAQVAGETGRCDLGKVVERVHDKMVTRHPHVFGDERLEDSASVRRAWEHRKAEETADSVLAGVPDSLPALLKAYRMSQKAAGVGFDWPDVAAIASKVEEELSEVMQEVSQRQASRRELREELGDLLLTVANLARKLDVDPESALAGANRKFAERFRRLENKLEHLGLRFQEADAARLDLLWNEVKSEES